MSRLSTFDNFPLVLRCEYGPFMGVVDRFHDGDTLLVDLDPGFDEGPGRWIRLEGVNAGELHLDVGKELFAYVERHFPPPFPVKVYTAKMPRTGGQVMSFARYVGRVYFERAGAVVSLNDLINEEIARLEASLLE